MSYHVSGFSPFRFLIRDNCGCIFLLTSHHNEETDNSGFWKKVQEVIGASDRMAIIHFVDEQISDVETTGSGFDGVHEAIISKSAVRVYSFNHNDMN